MLEIRQKGLQVSLPLDQAGFTSDPDANAKLAYVVGLKAGAPVAVDGDGYVQLADGDTANAPLSNVIGFLINDAAGEDWENRPAMASKQVAVAVGNARLVSDQIADVTFNEGDLLYAGTGADVGKITNVPPSVLTMDVTQADADETAKTTQAKVIGIALSPASLASPNLEFVVA